MNSKNDHFNLLELANNLKKRLSDVPELVHEWRFLSGVVYALDKYNQISDHSQAKNSVDKKAYIGETEDVISSILKKQEPPVGWLRGFYYNAALMRLDATYERFFKAYLDGKYNEHEECPKSKKSKLDGPVMYEKIRKEFSSLFQEEKYEDSNFHKVRTTVNNLKHDIGGADPMKREQPEVLHRALTELLDFLMEPRVREEFKKFSG